MPREGPGYTVRPKDKQQGARQAPPGALAVQRADYQLCGKCTENFVQRQSKVLEKSLVERVQAPAASPQGRRLRMQPLCIWAGQADGDPPRKQGHWRSISNCYNVLSPENKTCVGTEI